MFVIIISLFFTLSAEGQNLFFIGENSYPSTETITFKTNSDYPSYDLEVIFAKQGKLGLIAVSTKTVDEVIIRGKLIIYLNDGTVIVCNDAQIADYVDKKASSVYYFKTEDLSKMKKSNINTIRYTLEPSNQIVALGEGDFSASNKGVSTKAVLTEFFD